MDSKETPHIKPPTTFEEQIEILKIRGLIIEDEDFAFRILRKINYYRLSSYSLSLKHNDEFFSGVTFSQI